MIAKTRKNPIFALCGLNCGLCPRYHTDGPSKCPGCGGPDFPLKHPSCAVMTCNTKHDNVEYCFQCSSYPCQRYQGPGKIDSFVTYKNVLSDFGKAKTIGVERYLKELVKKIGILENLIKNYNDGRRKSFYCLATNLIALPDLEDIMEKVGKEINKPGLDLKEKARKTVELFEEAAKKKNIELKLRKP